MQGEKMSKWWIRALLVVGTTLLVLALWRMGALNVSGIPDVVSKGGEGPNSVVTYLTLATSLVSLLTAIVGLIKANVEAKKVAREAKR
jgi:Flp pilus assembly protein protease CpaA